MSLLYLYVFSRVLNKKYKKLMGLKSFGFVCNVLSLFSKIILKPVCIYRYYIFTSISNSCVVHLFGLPESECPGVCQLFLCCSLLITFLKVARNRGFGKDFTQSTSLGGDHCSTSRLISWISHPIFELIYCVIQFT